MVVPSGTHIMPPPVTVHITQETPTIGVFMDIGDPLAGMDIGIDDDELIELLPELISPPLVSLELELLDAAGAALEALLLHMSDVALFVQ